MADRIKVYYAEPFDASTEVDVNDVFLGNGVTTTFTLSEKTNLLLGSTVQASNVLYYYYNGGFTKAGSYNFTLSSAPGNGVGIVATGLSYLPFKAYDKAVVDGVTNPRISEIPFYIGNVDDIYLNKYIAAAGLGGISLSFVDHVSGDVIADTTWVELASATQDIAATAMTYVSNVMMTSEISAFCTLLCSVSAGVSSITADTLVHANSFVDGDYIVINRGGINQEVRKFLTNSSQTMTTTTLTYSHTAGETVYACARKFFGKMSVPENSTNHEAENFWNVALRIQGSIESRI